MRFPPERILVPTDLSEPSKTALAYARIFRERFGATVTVLHAEEVEVPPYFTRTQMGQLMEEVRSMRAQAAEYVSREAATVLGAAAETLIVGGPPTQAILKASEERQADLIVMGTHGRRGAERLWLGSVTERVFRLSRRPVLAVHGQSRGTPFERILCPVGWGETAREALNMAVAFTEAFGARLKLMHAVEEGEPPLTCPGVSEEVRKRCTIEETVVKGNAAENILRAARESGADLIVMGIERKSSVFGDLFSSTTERVIRVAEASMLVVPKEGQ